VNATGSILISGGAGFIGAHTLLSLHAAGHRIVVLDDLSTGCIDRIPTGVTFIKGSTGDAALVEAIARKYEVTAAIHFAGSIVAPVSLEQPVAYYRNNVTGTLEFMAGAAAGGVRRILFSSSAAVYAPQSREALTEAALTGPSTPYGWSKLIGERLIEDVARVHGISWLALRYFNVAGADIAGRVRIPVGQASHLIAAACEAALGRRPMLEVFGDDYDTPDGTCIRDFIHVSDLAEAHRLAIEDLERGGASGVLNCGYGRGVSVRQVADRMGAIVGGVLPIQIRPRRPGDIASVVANCDALRQRLDWRPQHMSLDTILRSTLAAIDNDA
jgi:UDP-glucose 4-epimerase